MIVGVNVSKDISQTHTVGQRGETDTLKPVMIPEVVSCGVREYMAFNLAHLERQGGRSVAWGMLVKA